MHVQALFLAANVIKAKTPILKPVILRVKEHTGYCKAVQSY
jgi:hypothetical protein